MIDPACAGFYARPRRPGHPLRLLAQGLRDRGAAHPRSLLKEAVNRLESLAMRHSTANPIDAARMRALFDYDPLAGILRFKERPVEAFHSPARHQWWTRQFCGRAMGCVTTSKNGKRYVITKVDGMRYSAHRIIWAIVHGGISPALEIDHEDGDGTNNRLSNLRLATRTTNGRNLKRSKSNTSGATGVSWHKRAGKWVAQGKMNDTMHYLGLFSSFDDAVAARRAWQNKHQFHHAHGLKG
jgi:hypothetical protein